jgi:hypothetical protein
MPRGASRELGVISGALRVGGPSGRAVPRRETEKAIVGTVQAFADAWFWGDSPGMNATLHPDYVNRLMALGAEARPFGIQAALGVFTPPSRRTVRVRVLEVRNWSASAVAELGGWVMHLHLARTEMGWKIVNAMWESRMAG